MLYDFVQEEITVRSEGLELHVSRPTLRTVYLFLGHFANEISILVRKKKQYEELKTDVRMNLVVSLFTSEAASARLASVLRSCVRPAKGLHGVLEKNEELRQELISAVMGICDMDRIVDSFDQDGFEEAIQEEQEEKEEVVQDHSLPEIQEIAVAQVSRFFGVSPMAVVNEWPFEAFLSASSSIIPYFSKKNSGTELVSEEALLSSIGAGRGITIDKPTEASQE